MPANGMGMSRPDVVVGRQPIFDRRREVHGYELVLRPGGPGADGHGVPRSRATSGDGDLLTSRVLFSSLQLGVDRFVGDKLMFCDVSEELLTGEIGRAHV
jgi:c-di-GMP-related signal transduction protein